MSGSRSNGDAVKTLMLAFLRCNTATRCEGSQTSTFLRRSSALRARPDGLVAGRRVGTTTVATSRDEGAASRPRRVGVLVELLQPHNVGDVDLE